MKFYSTKNKNHLVSLKEAVLKGLPPDNGLYMPQTIPQLPNTFFNSLGSKSMQEMAFEVANAFFGDDLNNADLEWVVEDAINFDAPLKAIHNDIFALELFHGPTMAFKDFGARFMSRLMSKIISKQDKTVHILVATSGDTGSAVAQGFYDVDGIHVTILYPSGKVSKIQEQQIATLDKNISTLEIDGTFDDCQHLVKTAFLDLELNKQILLSSANSINVARFIPQSFYYFYSMAQVLKLTDKPVVFSVPSGNFGNLTAGLFAQKMGLPVHHFVAAVNANDTFPRYLADGKFEAKPSVKTISNAMDVGNPSNLGRIFDLFNNDIDQIRNHISSYSFSDSQTKVAIREIFNSTNYLLDPHGAVGYLGMQKYLSEQESNPAGIVFETAHPAKFKDVVDDVISAEIEIPDRLKSFMERKKTSISISRNYSDFKEYLLSKVV
ncbi:MAG: threonine synthase [Calditrichaeota bacterium]|nr:MAG: threonine synthase [Calditrichota bacterium]MBL1205082.1 threonine synthase [Calditrichota bacterium]NOG44912.1 threonine synthase [Calditrichota bacterium]